VHCQIAVGVATLCHWCVFGMPWNMLCPQAQRRHALLSRNVCAVHCRAETMLWNVAPIWLDHATSSVGRSLQVLW
jgi:hypothetical protein